MPHVDEALLVAYADDALSSVERTDVEAHLVSCAECRARVTAERALAQRASVVLGFGAMPDDVVVPPFEAVVQRSERTDARPAAGGAPRRSMPPLAWAALLVVGLGAAWIARVLLISPEFAAPAEQAASSSSDVQQAERARPADAPISAAPPLPLPPADTVTGDADLRFESATAEAGEAAESQAITPEPDAGAAARPPAAAADEARAGEALLRRNAAQRADTAGFIAPAAPAAAPLAAAADAAEKTAPGTGAVAGRIIDAATNEPLVGGQVVVAGTTLAALTNREGEFVIRDVPPGTQTLRVQRLGYAAADLPVRVASDSSVTAEFALRPAGIALEALTVTGDVVEPGAVQIDGARTAWRGASAAAAGTVVRGIPDAAVDLVWIAMADADWRVRLVQRIDDAALEIVEWRSMPAGAAGRAGTLDDGRSYLFTTRGGVPLLLRGRLPVDRLRTLAGLVQPLP